MTDKKTEALKLALEALEELWGLGFRTIASKQQKAITAIREALASEANEQCVCGEHDTPGTHRTDGPCLAEQPAQQRTDYAWPTLADYERDVGFQTNEAFRAAWNMARTTNKMLGFSEPQPAQDQGQSCYCPECERLSKELDAIKAQQQEPVAWRELCRRLYIELYWCDRQMMETLDADGEPMWTQGKTVRDALADAKAALETSPQPAQQQEPMAYRHKWDKSGERCVKCGDKDWMGEACTVPDTSPPASKPLTSLEEELQEACKVIKRLVWNNDQQAHKDAGAFIAKHGMKEKNNG